MSQAFMGLNQHSPLQVSLDTYLFTAQSFSFPKREMRRRLIIAERLLDSAQQVFNRQPPPHPVIQAPCLYPVLLSSPRLPLLLFLKLTPTLWLAQRVWRWAVVPGSNMAQSTLLSTGQLVSPLGTPRNPIPLLLPTLRPVQAFSLLPQGSTGLTGGSREHSPRSVPSCACGGPGALAPQGDGIPGALGQEGEEPRQRQQSQSSPGKESFSQGKRGEEKLTSQAAEGFPPSPSLDF